MAHTHPYSKPNDPYFRRFRLRKVAVLQAKEFCCAGSIASPFVLDVAVPFLYVI